MLVFIRSLLFSIAFWIYTIGFCLLAIFAYALPRRGAWHVIKACLHGLYYIERIFLGLNYRVSGRENLPTDGHYILAIKHQSAYETMKLLDIFGDVAVILKRELALTPLWGWYTLKLGMIPVDRGGRNKAIASLLKGAKRVQAQNRPILIFPQGTRTRIDETPEDKPYKIGIARMAETLNLPVVPVALNSGVFWPKGSFIKHGGIVDFKIMPAIPAGLPVKELLQRLETVLETESNILVQDALARHGKPMMRKTPAWIKWPLLFLTVLTIAWVGWWHKAASMVHEKLDTLPITSPFEPVVDGFPGPVRVTWPDVTFQSSSGTINLPVLEARAWPVPAGRGELIAPQGFTLETTRDNKPVRFEAQDLTLHFGLPGPNDFHLTGIDLKSGETTLNGKGHIAIPINNDPVNGDIEVVVTDYDDFLDTLAAQRVIEKNAKKIAGDFFDVMSVTQGHSGTVDVPLSVKDDVVYAGFIRLVDIKDLRAPADQSVTPPQKTHSGDSATDAPRAPDL